MGFLGKIGTWLFYKGSQGASGRGWVTNRASLVNGSAKEAAQVPSLCSFPGNTVKDQVHNRSLGSWNHTREGHILFFPLEAWLDISKMNNHHPGLWVKIRGWKKNTMKRKGPGDKGGNRTQWKVQDLESVGLWAVRGKLGDTASLSK